MNKRDFSSGSRNPATMRRTMNMSRKRPIEYLLIASRMKLTEELGTASTQMAEITKLSRSASRKEIIVWQNNFLNSGSSLARALPSILR